MWLCHCNAVVPQRPHNSAKIDPDNPPQISRVYPSVTQRTFKFDVVQSADLPQIPLYQEFQVHTEKSDYKHCQGNAYLMERHFPYLDSAGDFVMYTAYHENPTKRTYLTREDGDIIELVQNKSRMVEHVRYANYSSQTSFAEDFLGAGHYARVRLAEEVTQSGSRNVAILTVALDTECSPSLRMIEARSIVDPSSRYQLKLRESYKHSKVSDLSSFQRPLLYDSEFVAKVEYGYIEKKSTPSKGTYYRCRLVMPHYESLTKFSVTSSQQATDMALHLVRGLRYLHELGSIHGDIKPDNILCDTEGIPRFNDFDFALNFNVGNPTLRLRGGTPRFIAPEIYNQRQLPNVTFRQACQADAYALGVTLYFLFSYPESEKIDRIPEIYGEALSCPRYFTEIQKHVCKGLLAYSPYTRMDLECAEGYLRNQL